MVWLVGGMVVPTEGAGSSSSSGSNKEAKTTLSPSTSTSLVTLATAQREGTFLTHLGVGIMGVFLGLFIGAVGGFGAGYYTHTYLMTRAFREASKDLFSPPRPDELPGEGRPRFPLVPTPRKP